MFSEKLNAAYDAYIAELEAEAPPPPNTAAVSHADLLRRVSDLLGFPPFGPIQLIDDRVVHRTPPGTKNPPTGATPGNGGLTQTALLRMTWRTSPTN